MLKNKKDPNPEKYFKQQIKATAATEKPFHNSPKPCA